jgi:hypothetical protein
MATLLSKGGTHQSSVICLVGYSFKHSTNQLGLAEMYNTMEKGKLHTEPSALKFDK